MLDVARGLAYLHTHRPPIIHADLKGVRTIFFSFVPAPLTSSVGWREACLSSPLEQRTYHRWWSRRPVWFWSFKSSRRSRNTHWIDAFQSWCRSYTVATSRISRRYWWTSLINIRRMVIWMYRLRSELLFETQLFSLHLSFSLFFFFKSSSPVLSLILTAQEMLK